MSAQTGMSLTLCWVLLSLPCVSFSTPLTRHLRQTMDLTSMDNSNATDANTGTSNNNGNSSSDIGNSGVGSGQEGVPNLPFLGQVFGGPANASQPGFPTPDANPQPEHVGPGGLPFISGGGQLCINMCYFGPYCDNGGTCQFNETTCERICLCPPGLDPQKRCMNTSLPTFSTADPLLNSDTTLRPLFERNCNGSFQFECQHGKCATNNDTRGFMCLCDENFTGGFCEDECTSDCGSLGTCRLDAVTKEEYCSCPYPWQGSKCDQLPPPDIEDPGWKYWLGGGLGVGLLLLLGCGVALMVLMWRRRFILVMKIVHYLQPYEDDDGKLFDAFVSYRSSPEDLSFVYNFLRHKLEGDMQFRLCLHERDFAVGEAIANNIIWATENSRRTILVISPRYLDSDWARMEYQRAQYEALKRKQRIIPIMLEDVSDFQDKMDPNLAYILKTVTYLEHPGPDADSKEMDKFWKRLQLSMPKKRDTSSSTSLAGSDATPKSILSNGDLGTQDDPPPTDPAHVVFEPTTEQTKPAKGLFRLGAKFKDTENSICLQYYKQKPAM